MDEDQMTTSDPMDRLGHKIDALTSAVGAMDTRLGGVEKDVGEVKDRLSTVEAGLSRVETRLFRVETRLSHVETRLSHVETQMSGVEKELTKVHVLAGETNTFSKNVWDSLTSLTRNVEEGFKEAKKDREERLDLVHKAIRRWGGRVDTLETAPPRATKRRP